MRDEIERALKARQLLEDFVEGSAEGYRGWRKTALPTCLRLLSDLISSSHFTSLK